MMQQSLSSLRVRSWSLHLEAVCKNKSQVIPASRNNYGKLRLRTGKREIVSFRKAVNLLL